MQLDQDEVKQIKKTLENIARAKNDYDIYRDFIISCKNSNIAIPDKIKSFIISELEKQQE